MARAWERGGADAVRIETCLSGADTHGRSCLCALCLDLAVSTNKQKTQICCRVAPPWGGPGSPGSSSRRQAHGTGPCPRRRQGTTCRFTSELSACHRLGCPFGKCGLTSCSHVCVCVHVWMQMFTSLRCLYTACAHPRLSRSSSDHPSRSYFLAAALLSSPETIATVLQCILRVEFPIRGVDDKDRVRLVWGWFTASNKQEADQGK